MDDHAGFDSVSWQRGPEIRGIQNPALATLPHEAALPTRPANGKRSMDNSNEPQAGLLADRVDLGGIGDGVLECTVDTPLKENDGTKDAYVSYLVTTTVRFPGWFAMYVARSMTKGYTRQTSNLSRNPTFQFADASPTSSSSGRLCTESTLHVQSLLYLRRITCLT